MPVKPHGLWEIVRNIQRVHAQLTGATDLCSGSLHRKKTLLLRHSKNDSGTPLTSSAPTPASRPRNTPHPSLASSSCASPKSASPPSAPRWRRPAHRLGVVRVWVNLPPTQPKHSCIRSE